MVVRYVLSASVLVFWDSVEMGRVGVAEGGLKCGIRFVS